MFRLLGTLELALAQPSVLMEKRQWAQEWQDALGVEWSGSSLTVRRKACLVCLGMWASGMKMEPGVLDCVI